MNDMNKSFLSEEAKKDIKDILGVDGGGGISMIGEITDMKVPFPSSTRAGSTNTFFNMSINYSKEKVRQIIENNNAVPAILYSYSSDMYYYGYVYRVDKTLCFPLEYSCYTPENLPLESESLPPELTGTISGDILQEIDNIGTTYGEPEEINKLDVFAIIEYQFNRPKESPEQIYMEFAVLKDGTLVLMHP